MFEHRRAPLLPRAKFLARLARSAAISCALVAGSLSIGVLGYHWVGHLRWIDSVLNASMILTGMGPVDEMKSDPAKLFAAGYALFSGVAFLTIITILLAPVAHRFLHKFHLESQEQGRE